MGTQVRDGETAEVTDRRRLPDERRAVTHDFRVGGTKCFITAGLYEDGKVGEVFLQAGHGSMNDVGLTGLLDGWAIAFSMALQYGCPLENLVEKFERTRFEPAGLTGNPKIPMASSIFDYCARWLRARFLDAPAVSVPTPVPVRSAKGRRRQLGT